MLVDYWVVQMAVKLVLRLVASMDYAWAAEMAASKAEKTADCLDDQKAD